MRAWQKRGREAPGLSIVPAASSRMRDVQRRKVRPSSFVAGFALTALLGAWAACAAEGDERRGSVPPGTSQDGSRPSEGAIKGGSIEPKQGGESEHERSLEVERRCRDLTGTLRTQCIEDARKQEPESRAPR